MQQHGSGFKVAFDPRRSNRILFFAFSADAAAHSVWKDKSPSCISRSFRNEVVNNMQSQKMRIYDGHASGDCKTRTLAHAAGGVPWLMKR